MLIKEDLTLGSTNLDRRERQARSDRAHRSTDPWWVAVQRRRHTPPRVPPNSRGPCWGTAALDRIFCRVLASLSVRRASTSRPDAVRPHPVAEAAEAACRRWVFSLLHIYIYIYLLTSFVDIVTFNPCLFRSSRDTFVHFHGKKGCHLFFLFFRSLDYYSRRYS